jgi:DNA-binding GntR family transcriptional regulator
MAIQELRESIGEADSRLSGADRESQTISLSQKAYEQIKQKILDLDLPPGSIIDETRLQNELSLGRTPIREALLRLSFEKLVTIIPRRGIFVAEIGITDLQEIFEIRITLEVLAARLAAQRGSEAHWIQIESILNRLSTLEECGSYELTTLDEACHRIMYEAANNELLRDNLNTLYALSHRLWRYLLVRPDGVQSWLKDHQEILEALRVKDSARAGYLIEQHVRSYQESIQAAILRTPLTSKS